MPTNELRRSDATPTGSLSAISIRWIAGIVLSMLLIAGAAVQADAESVADEADTVAAALTFDRHVVTFPDEIGPTVGGAAARVRVQGGEAVSGDLFALFGKDGSDAQARVYDATPYTLVRLTPHPEMVEANETAATVAGDILGHDVIQTEFTSAPGGGYSAGLTYVIAYLNAASGGAFTGGVRVAATGTLDDDGYSDRVTAIDEKTAAAHLAGVDVMFTTSTPSYVTLDAYAARFEGELHRARRTGLPLAAERAWAGYERLGAQRLDGAMDLIAVAHLGDVAAYLCGAGSTYACDVRATLDDVHVEPTATIVAAAADLETPVSAVSQRAGVR